MEDLERWYQSLPVVTRGYLTLSVLTTLACNFDIISPYSLYFNVDSILNGEVWRIVTNFLFFGEFGFDFLFHIYFVGRYSRSLEETSFHRRPADFFYMLLLGGTMMTIAGLFVKIVFMGHSLSFMMVYVWSRRNRHQRMNFLGVFNFNAPYLPWVLLGFTVMLGGAPTTDLMGIIAGHIYYFFEDIYPRISNRCLLKTPGFIVKVTDLLQICSKALFGQVEH